MFIGAGIVLGFLLTFNTGDERPLGSLSASALLVDGIHFISCFFNAA